jgi:signal peptidase I
MIAGSGDTAVTEAPSKRGLAFRGVLEIVETLVLTVLIFFVVHTFVAQPFRVEQSSMVSTLLPDQYVLVDKLTPHWAEYERGDIVVFLPPASWRSGQSAPFIKRVIGLPGDRIDLMDGFVIVNGVQLDEPYLFARKGEPEPTEPSLDGTTSWRVPDGSLFVMGDHRAASADSREFGPIPVSTVLGRALLRYWPIDTFGPLERPTYAGFTTDSN